MGFSLTMFASCFLPVALQEVQHDRELTGVWIVGQEDREHADGRRTTVNGNKFVVFLPGRIILLNPFERSDKVHDFAIVGKKVWKHGQVLLLCRDQDGLTMRMKLNTIENLPANLKLLLKGPYPSILEESNTRRRLVKIDGQWKPSPLNENVTTVNYTLNTAKVSDWGAAIKGELANGDKFKNDVELAEAFRDWASTAGSGEQRIAPQSPSSPTLHNKPTSATR